MSVPGNDLAAETPRPTRRRIGRFIVGHGTFASDWRALQPLFARVVPVRAESLFHLAGIEYLALGEDFDEIELHEAPPLYDVRWQYDEQGREVITFCRALAEGELTMERSELSRAQRSEVATKGSSAIEGI